MHILPDSGEEIDSTKLMQDLEFNRQDNGIVRYVFEDRPYVRAWPILALWVFKEDNAYSEVDDILDKYGWARKTLEYAEEESSRYTLPGVWYEEWTIVPDLTKTEIWAEVDYISGPCNCDSCKRAADAAMWGEEAE